MLPTPTETGITQPPPKEIEEQISSQALLILISLLILTLLVSYTLQRRKIRIIHETVVSIVAGMAVGLCLRLAPSSAGDPQKYLRDMVTFDHTIFFNLLLPPIILNCGFCLQRTAVDRNLIAILAFAFVGTVISAVVIGFLVRIFALTGIEGISLSGLDSLIIGAILSATDPVTILAVFEQLRVDPKLYSIIFGETVLNDAAAIVLFVTLGEYKRNGGSFGLGSVPVIAWAFVNVFGVSMLVGVGFGVLAAILYKHTELSKFPTLESSLLPLIAYSAYLASNTAEMSGIVSLLFCGATLRRYAYRSLSVRSQRTARYLFRILASMSENFIFVYLGISLFTASETVVRPVFILYVMISTLISRYCAIFPISRLLNSLYKLRYPNAPSSSQPVTHEEQTMLFWAGLRGAVACALAGEVPGEAGSLMKTTVLCVVIISVILLGGTTPSVVQQLGIPTDVPQPDSSDEEAEEEAITYGQNDDDNYDGDDNEGAMIVIEEYEQRPPRRRGSGDNDGGLVVDVSTGHHSANEAENAHYHGASPDGSGRGRGRGSGGDNDDDDAAAKQRFFSSNWAVVWTSRWRSVNRSRVLEFERNYIVPLLTKRPDRKNGFVEVNASSSTSLSEAAGRRSRDARHQGRHSLYRYGR
ncbi:monovalent cation:H+ antiporter, CPA1 (nhx1) [Spiromyces aspiralis]|uniref:Monovalent cation:H+ antiporter, CPA1 (Nhx1) n=1 Tax=Spiromyces aspiralis TaxID=68401 RepID=A0ACC1HH28_9FUNG|nr:monovalent cation:H+ antiporter, CPA1 (nhx1) [Spiromyces aspiralis]